MTTRRPIGSNELRWSRTRWLRKMFWDLPHAKPRQDVVATNSELSGLCFRGLFQEAPVVF